MQAHALFSRPSRTQKIAAIALVLIALVLVRFWMITQAAHAADATLPTPLDPAVEQLTQSQSVSAFIASGGVVADADPSAFLAPDVVAHAPDPEGLRAPQPIR